MEKYISLEIFIDRLRGCPPNYPRWLNNFTGHSVRALFIAPEAYYIKYLEWTVKHFPPTYTQPPYRIH